MPRVYSTAIQGVDAIEVEVNTGQGDSRIVVVEPIFSVDPCCAKIRYAFLMFVIICGLSGCVSPWPDLPPVTYQGYLENGVTGVPVSGATVTASRPKLRGFAIFPVGNSEIGSTVSGEGGEFTMRTSGGRATRLSAASPDHKLACSIEVARFRSRHCLKMEPFLRSARFRAAVDPMAEDTKLAHSAIFNIMEDIVRNQGRLRSLREYKERHVISAKAFEVFAGNPKIYFGEDPEALFQWGDDVFVIQNISLPISLVHHRK